MNDQALSEAVSALADEPRTICVFEVENGCPAGWGVIIAAAGVNFYYKDGTSETVGPRPVNLSTGQKASFSSTKLLGCVKSSLLAMKVVIPGDGAKDMTYKSPDAGADQCYIHDGVILGPKSFAAPEDMLSARIEIRAM